MFPETAAKIAQHRRDVKLFLAYLIGPHAGRRRRPLLALSRSRSSLGGLKA